MDLSVGDIAEQIMAQGARTRGVKAPTFTPDPSVYSNKVGAQAPDISEIEVPLDFVSSIVEGKDQVVEAKVSPTPPASPISEDTELKTLRRVEKSIPLRMEPQRKGLLSLRNLGLGSTLLLLRL